MKWKSTTSVYERTTAPFWRAVARNRQAEPEGLEHAVRHLDRGQQPRIEQRLDGQRLPHRHVAGGNVAGRAAGQERILERQVALVERDEKPIVELESSGMIRRRIRFSSMHSIADSWSRVQ